ncbi:MAG TPA: hypothetical protein VL551_22080 [Actinospica sp.]|jgi:hypothetical protein|nr:hypothetical protein [Actinospica sp.]
MERYDYWSQVPEHLRTKTQLADLDLPRIHGGEPVAYVHDRGPHGRKRDYDLYDLYASLPSPATGGQLQAARERQTSGRRCEKCGARPDQLPTPHRVGDEDGFVLLCYPCLHIARLCEAQQRVAADRRTACEISFLRVVDDTVACVHVSPIAPPPGPDGRAKKPIALNVGAVTARGGLLYRAAVRLNRSRNPLVPADAIPAEEAFGALREAVAGREVIEWNDGALKPLNGALTAPAEPARTWRDILPLAHHVAAWRGHINPRTYRLTTPLDPGRADLMALLIRRMAADRRLGDGDFE